MAAALDSAMKVSETEREGGEESLELSFETFFFYTCVWVKVWTGTAAVKVLTLWGCVSGL